MPLLICATGSGSGLARPAGCLGVASRPWEHSTGPRTAEGKARCSRNSYRGGQRQFFREAARVLRQLRDADVRLAYHLPRQGGGVALDRVDEENECPRCELHPEERTDKGVPP